VPALRRPRAGTPLAVGFVTTFLFVVVLLPIAALVWSSGAGGWHEFWSVASAPEAVASLELTLGAAALVAAIDAAAGTAIAWVLVRDEFRGRGLMNAVIDLPFALPTVVAGLTLLALYGPMSPLGVDVAYSRTAIVLALLFETLPFVVRTVQPVLHELDREAEEAARLLGAADARVFRSVVLPGILPGILSGVALAFARAVGEIGAIVLISGNLPFRTEVAAVFVLNRIQGGDEHGAAAVATVMLAVAFGVLLTIGVLRHVATRHERA
jgi:sulfate transport system permease protein